MPQNSTDGPISFLLGSETFLESCPSVPVRRPFDGAVIDYLDKVSKLLLANPVSKAYPDVITFAFWIRKASMITYRRSYADVEGQHVVGKGVVFHVAPSNVAVNFAYSLVSGLLAGNVNVVRVPSKPFPQIDIIAEALESALSEYGDMSDYVCLIRYGHDTAINDRLSSMADVRVIWGGDETIAVFRESPLKPRATEVLFANRFSLAVIDSDAYIQINDKRIVAQEFYTDTYLTDQNACSSPKAIIWLGTKKDEAKKEFWHTVRDIVSDKYRFQQIQGVDKYLQVCLAASKLKGTHIVQSDDNLIIRVRLDYLRKETIDCFGNSGFFFEYDAGDVSDMREICNDSRCQTITYIGDPKMFGPLLETGMKGIDRIVPFGKSMDFELIWDGYDLMKSLTRIITVRDR